MPQNLDVEVVVSNYPWNCNECSGKGPSPVLHPDASWCKFCGMTKLTCAELLMSNFIEMILKTWIRRPSDKLGEVVVTAIHVEEIRTMIWNHHSRHSAGLLNEAWSDA